MSLVFTVSGKEDEDSTYTSILYTILYTEHLIECKKAVGGMEISREELKNGDDVDKWKGIIKKVEWNITNRKLEIKQT